MSDFLSDIEQLSPEQRELLEMLLNEGDTRLQAPYVAPRTPVEELLASIWGQVLGIERVGIHDNFLELGGDSIHTIQVVDKAYQIGLQFRANQLFDCPTIAELATVVESFSVEQAKQEPVRRDDVPSFTPADFPEAELSQAELNKLFSKPV